MAYSKQTKEGIRRRKEMLDELLGRQKRPSERFKYPRRGRITKREIAKETIKGLPKAAGKVARFIGKKPLLGDISPIKRWIQTSTGRMRRK